MIILLEILLFLLIYYLYNRNKGQNILTEVKVKIYQRKSKYIKGGQTMVQNSSPHTDSTALNDTSITTSANNKELAKRIKDISQQVLKRNYELYKALENK